MVRVDDLDNRNKIFDKLKAQFVAVYGDDFDGKTVLDFGSGPRGYVLKWSEMFGLAYASDLRDFAADYAGTGVEFAQSDGRRVDRPDASVDVIVSHSVLEHVSDLPAVFSDMNRLLRIGGHVFLTVSPLYYSPAGLHNKRQGITNWEHLDPSHPAYLSSTPFWRKRPPLAEGEEDESGALLNKKPLSEFLEIAAAMPWRTDHLKKETVKAPIPEWVDVERFGHENLITKGFILAATKLR